MSESKTNSKIIIAALYKFIEIPDFSNLKLPILNACKKNNIKGTLLLASEGINGTIAGSEQDINNIINYIKNIKYFSDLEYKISFADPGSRPFLRMKVKLKKEIVTLGVKNLDINNIKPAKKTGEYVTPENWNNLISDPDVCVVDTRNNYETDIGTFENALIPNTTNFREFPDFVKKNLKDKKHKKIAMFCTGGIRCEKSTAYLLQQGFKHVFHLKGGILKYLEDTPKETSLWNGECFVFDNRVTVDHSLNSGSYDQCYGCRHPISKQDQQSSKYLAGIHCSHCYDNLNPKKLNRATERQRQVTLNKKNQQPHIGN